ncbi:MAG: hypothetical protein JSS81_22865 [Acidobacteria bacterium]|nr:hypothetical protein [Acidobacteriota bacterium]
MFGLMRAKKCGMSDEEKRFRRLNYCGTCKTIGRLYGSKSRFLLNHDTVFLAELLSALSGEDPAGWTNAYQSFNCLRLPASEMPFALEFAATANLILTEFKLADHVADERKRRYRFARKAFSEEFKKAAARLKAWDFPLAEVETVLATQAAREASEKSLAALAYPTAQTTALFFREGVCGIGRAELAETAFGLGFAFGRLVYLVDAFEDYEKDFRAGKFNAFRAAFGLTEAKLSPEARRRIGAKLRAAESEIAEKLRALPLADGQKTLFVGRLSQNLGRKLKTGLPVLKTAKACAVRPRPTFGERWRAAGDRARSLAGSYGWQMPLVFLFVFAFALVAPAQSREARSARECFDLSFNLMFLGALATAFVSSVGSAIRMTGEEPPAGPVEAVEQAVTGKKGRKRGGGSGGGDDDDGCCCCCWDGCDGCCDCGDCCDGCDCDCCSGCCDGCDCDCGGCCDC